MNHHPKTNDRLKQTEFSQGVEAMQSKNGSYKNGRNNMKRDSQYG